MDVHSVAEKESYGHRLSFTRLLLNRLFLTQWQIFPIFKIQFIKKIIIQGKRTPQTQQLLIYFPDCSPTQKETQMFHNTAVE